MDHNLNRNTGAVELRELAAIDNYELLASLVETAHAISATTVLPSEFKDSQVADTLHSRFNKVQGIETYHPDCIEEKIREGLRRRHVEDRFANNSLDEIVNKVGPVIVGSGFLTEAGLLKTEQLLFLRGVIWATEARSDEARRNPEKRYSNTQRKLQAAAISHVNHLMTNRVAVPRTFGREQLDDFTVAYSAAYLAKIVKDEAAEQKRHSQYSTSIKMCMLQPIPFGRLKSRVAEEVVSVFPNGETGGGEGLEGAFKKRMPSGIEEARIENLRNIQDTFGDNETIFTFYEGMKPFRVGGSRKRTPTGAAQHEEGTLVENPDDKYFILEIKAADKNDELITHVVADNPVKNNSAYALREEVLVEWEKLTGIKLGLRDVFSQTRKTARNLGARDFRHNKGSNVPERIRKYLNQDPQSLVLETFGRIFDAGEREYFDDDMNPTNENTMPTLFLEAVRNSVPLRALWPMIREHGYEQTQRILLGSSRAKQEAAAQIDKEQKRTDVRAYAAQLFAQMAQREVDQRP